MVRISPSKLGDSLFGYAHRLTLYNIVLALWLQEKFAVYAYVELTVDGKFLRVTVYKFEETRE